MFVLNEFDPDTTFYRFFQVESFIRTIAEKYRNSYQIAIFACCRENLDLKRHSGGVSRLDAALLQKLLASAGKEFKNLIEKEKQA